MSICVEKTPGNLIMTRFLQAAFPSSYFVVIKRHPVAVSLATQKWTMSALHRLFEHWLHCYALFEEDKPHLTNVYEVRYEDYVQAPDKYHQQIAIFIGSSVPNDGMESLTAAQNDKYLAQWSHLLLQSRADAYYRHIAAAYEPRFAKHGYSLLHLPGLAYYSIEAPPRAAGWIYCRLAEATASVRRLHRERMELVTKPMRSFLPLSFKARVKQALQKKSLRWVARILAPMWESEVHEQAK
jgi:hypothetical protein